MAEGSVVHFVFKGVAASGTVVKRAGMRVRVEVSDAHRLTAELATINGTKWVEVEELMSAEDAAAVVSGATTASAVARIEVVQHTLKPSNASLGLADSPTYQDYVNAGCTMSCPCHCQYCSGRR